MAMKKIAFYNGKGGSGKTTSAVHVGVVAAHKMRTAIIDLDIDMENALAWSRERKLRPPSVLATTPTKLSRQLDHLADQDVELAILDFPPNLSTLNANALNLVDLIVIPVQPTFNDLNGYYRAINIIRSSGRPFVFLINRAPGATQEVADTVQVLSTFGEVCPTHIGDRIAFSRSMGLGKSVMEYQSTGKAAHESVEVCNWILNKLEGVTQ